MTKLLYRLGRVCARRRWRVLLVWIAVAVVAIGTGQASGGEPSDALDVPGVESQEALDVLEEEFPQAAGTSAQLVFAVEDGTLADPDVAQAVSVALADVDGQPDVAGVGELHESPDGRVGFANVQYERPAEEIRTEAFSHLEETADTANASGVVQMELGGDLPSEAETAELGSQEFVGLIVAAVVLLVAFGSLVAMGLPLALAIFGMVVSSGLTLVVASFTEVLTFSTTIAAMLGIAAGIDYALFIVTRHREHLQRGLTVEDSIGRALGTAGAAVLFAGATVVIAITGLALAGIPVVTTMGFVAALAVAIMVAISLTLLPALLGFAGHKIDAIRLPRLGRRRRAAVSANGSNGHQERETMWHRWGRTVAARPWRYLLGSTAVLLLLAAPVLGLRLGIPDNGNSPDSLSTRRAYDLLSEGFGAGFNGPLLLSVTTGDDSEGFDATLTELSDTIADDPGVRDVEPAQVNPEGSAAVLRVIPETSPQADETTDLVHRLRDQVIPAATSSSPGTDVYVGGQAAFFIDISEKVEQRLPWFIGAVIMLSVVLLTVVFRSVAVPLKAAAMNLLSIGASYGIIVAVFQWGWLGGLFGVEETVPIISFLPMMLFAILFGLSMDYEVFLLSRVRESYLESRDNDAAVIEGLSSTARVITSAALIMISVFAGFVLNTDPTIKMFGLGLATAVFIDATLVRVVLVPATMKLLGDWNWWLPGWLDRRLPNLDIEGGQGLPAPEMEPLPEPEGDRRKTPIPA